VQTTLLGLGIAIILAIVAALVGPYFVDWTQYRHVFEAEASRAIGLPVRIAGAIDARLLPVPSITLHNVDARTPAGEARFKAREIAVEFELGALMRGEWRATDMRLTGPQVGIGLTPDGRIDWTGTNAGIDPENLSIERLTIEGGRIVLADAGSASWAVLDKFSFEGDARSLAGPFKGEGEFTTGGVRHAYRLNAGRMGDDGGMRLRLVLNRGDGALIADGDGSLRLERGSPRFDGAVTLKRAPGVDLVSGRAVELEPWSVATRVKMSSAATQFEQIDLQYGPEDRALKLAGTGELTFGHQPRLDLAVSGRQLDIDRFVTLPEGTKRLPFSLVRGLGVGIGQVLQAGTPARIGLSVDTVTLGTASLQTLRAELSTEGEGWAIQGLEFRAPGVTQVRASGNLKTESAGPSFVGPVNVESADQRALLAWLEGRASTAGVPLGAFRASGELTLAGDRIGVEGLQAELDRRQISGRFAYRWVSDTQQPRLEAELRAPDFDFDAATAWIRNAFPGASFDIPVEVALGFDLGRAKLSGVEARNAQGKLAYDGTGLVLERLSIEDLAGARIGAAGRVQGPWTAPRGNLRLDLAGDRLGGVLALLANMAPRLADQLNQRVGALSPANLGMTMALEPGSTPASTGTTGKFRVEGTAGRLRLNADADLVGEVANWSAAQLRTNGQIDADGRELAALLNLDRAVAVGAGPGSLLFTATGPLSREMKVEARFTAPGAQISGTGSLNFAAAGTAGKLDLSARFANATGLRALVGTDGAAPLEASTRVTLDDQRITFDSIKAKLAGTTLAGRLVLLRADGGLDGQIEADTLNASALLAGLAGMPQHAARRLAQADSVWPTVPFVAGALPGVSANVRLHARQATLTPTLAVQQLQARLRLSESEAAVEEIAGRFLGGRLTGDIAVQSGFDGRTLSTRLGLNDADLGMVLGADSPLRGNGRFNAQLELKGSGRSPAALATTLGGSGAISLQGLELTGFDSQVFDSVTHAVDQGMGVDAARVRAVVENAINSGRVRIGRADGALAVTAGQIRLSTMLARGDRANLIAVGLFDLAQSTVDARIALAGQPSASAAVVGRPEIYVNFRGPLGAVQRSVDVSALVGWLTLRAVDMQAKRLEAVETERKRADEAAARAEAARIEAARNAPPPVLQTPGPRSSAQPSGPAPDSTATVPSAPPQNRPQPLFEQAPALPPPLEIRPAPNVRRSAAPPPVPPSASP
jgi:large subunit ribosomal protein L24